MDFGTTGKSMGSMEKTQGKLRQPAGPRDELAAILEGLQLDQSFFVNRMAPGAMEALLPKVRGEKPLNYLVNEAEPGKAVLTAKARPLDDFDIYLNEALMPVLAQSLDALTRQLARMEQQGDALDPKVRARFNPLTFLGQQLLRRHPKCARTPRRTAMYRSFKDYGDYEKGRRDFLRIGKTDFLKKIFDGFKLKGAVNVGSIPSVIDALDDALHLSGTMKNHVEMQRFGQKFNEVGPLSPLDHSVGGKRGGGTVTFEKFWYHMVEVIMAHDIIPASSLVKGKEAMAKQAAERAAWEAEQARLEEERIAKAAADAELEKAYAELYTRLKADENITAICEECKILTGDDMRPGDTGYEFEVKPIGPHVSLLSELLVLLGFEQLLPQEEEEAAEAQPALQKDPSVGGGRFRASADAMAAAEAAKAKGNAGPSPEDKYYDKKLAECWMVVQKTFDSDIVDGVVESEILKQCLVAPGGFCAIKAKVEDEVERQANNGKVDDQDLELDEKPTMEELCTRHGITMSRLDWLHELFESFLEPDPENPDEPPKCFYPEDPASLNRDQMRGIIGDINPGLTEAEFDARFHRIDTDGSGMIEFDEFVQWISADEVKIAGADGTMLKMTFEELAHLYKEPVELIEYLHACFQDALPDGEIDDYPDDTAGLMKAEAWGLAQMLTPNISRNDFEVKFNLIDERSAIIGDCDFDEFLEIIDFSQLPAELRDRMQAGNDEN